MNEEACQNWYDVSNSAKSTYLKISYLHIKLIVSGTLFPVFNAESFMTNHKETFISKIISLYTVMIVTFHIRQDMKNSIKEPVKETKLFVNFVRFQSSPASLSIISRLVAIEHKNVQDVIGLLL